MLQRVSKILNMSSSEIHFFEFLKNGSDAKFVHGSQFSGENKNNYCRISSGHIIPFGDSQDIIPFHCFIVT